MVIIIIAWFFHIHTHPYKYRFQNYVEQGLFATSIVVILLGIIHSVAWNEGYRGTELDVTLVTVLVSSLLIAVGNLTWNYRKHQRQIALELQAGVDKVVHVADDLGRALSHFGGQLAAKARTATRRGRLQQNQGRASDDTSSGRQPSSQHGGIAGEGGDFRHRNPLDRTRSGLTGSSASGLQTASHQDLTGFFGGLDRGGPVLGRSPRLAVG